jgi:hypothetical protein
VALAGVYYTSDAAGRDVASPDQATNVSKSRNDLGNELRAGRDMRVAGGHS